jgi:hypothetical protein
MAPRVFPETEGILTIYEFLSYLFRSVVDLESRVLATLPLEDDF